MIILRNVKFNIDTDFGFLENATAKVLGIAAENIKSVKLHKKSLDCRKRNDIHFLCSLIVCGNEKLLLKKGKKYSAEPFIEKPITWKKCGNVPKLRPIIVGFGPAGMFAGLTLCYAGFKPIIIEQGPDADTRIADIENFFKTGKLTLNSNVQFGEGGAGTFSDGKLTTGIKDRNIKKVLQTFYENGAKEDILYDSKPHIGTDILVTVVKNIRQKIISMGGEVRFLNKLESIDFCENSLVSITVNGEVLHCEDLILAVGHSARDTFSMLYDKGIEMQAKPFAVGGRIEHKQSDIDKAQYGEKCGHRNLKPADYKLAVHLENGRGVYTFCMCPGGFVVNASSEGNAVAVNGMSYSSRDNENANSAILVGLNPEDFEGGHPLRGMYFQQKIERQIFDITNSYSPLCVTVGNFLEYKTSNKLGNVTPSVKPEFVFGDIDKIYPDFVTDSIRDGIKLFDRKIKGFADKNAVLTFPETRSSSPVRILRNENFNANIKGVYPCGEGAGYAGGITSAAVDGIRVAESIIEKYGIQTDPS